jgi:hypothetical protein
MKDIFLGQPDLKKPGCGGSRVSGSRFDGGNVQ